MILIGLVAASVHATQAETFFSKDGSVVEGTVLRSLGNTLSIKLDAGGMQQLPLSAIDRIEITARDGGRVAGMLAWWKNGVYVLLTEEGLIEVRDGVIGSIRTSDTETELLRPNAEQGVVAPAFSTLPLADEQQSPKLEPTM